MYEHTQRAPVQLLLLAVAVAMGLSGWAYGEQHEPLRMWLLIAMAGMFVFLGMCFGTLTVRDLGDSLQVQFGPLPVFGRLVRYDQIESAKPSRSRIIDGWGIHWLPGRGTTYNLWGLDCVELTVKGRTLRIGTDDPPGLTAVIAEHTGVDVSR